MDLNLSENAFNFSQLILKHYSTTSKKEEEEKGTKETENEPKVEQIDPKAKYSLDYKKKFGAENENQEKEEKNNADFDSNAYYQQMACTHDRRKERELFEKSTFEKLEAAEFFKNEGNDALKAKDFQKAAFFYQNGLLQLDYTFPENPEDDKRFLKIQEQLHFNMGLAKYFLKDNDTCLTHLHQVHFLIKTLKLNPKHVKALYRKAMIFFERDLFEETQTEISRILEIDSECKEALKLRADLETKRRLYNEKSKKVMKEMLS